jgi:hypothetical protein
MTNEQKTIQHAITVRDSLRDLAVMSSCNERELHRMADRVDVIAKEIGMTALTLKAAGANAPAFRRQGENFVEYQTRCLMSTTDEVKEISWNELPAQFRPENFDWSAEASIAFKQYNRDNSIYYYARPRESFFKSEAFELARAANCTKLLMEDMS